MNFGPRLNQYGRTGVDPCRYVLIDYLAGVQPIAGEIASYIQSDGLLTTAINCFELLSGAQEGKRGDAVRRLVHLIPF
jgi:hypothetical protein